MAEISAQPELPPYTYVPGRDPHPTRDPRGHSYGARAGSQATSDGLRRGLALFDHGYYWEAHEAWEAPFRQAPLGSPERRLYKALIALAAAGVKVRQELPAPAVRFAERAARVLGGLRAEHGPRLLGLDLSSLEDFAVRAARDTAGLSGQPDQPVVVVFHGRLGAKP